MANTKNFLLEVSKLIISGTLSAQDWCRRNRIQKPDRTTAQADGASSPVQSSFSVHDGRRKSPSGQKSLDSPPLLVAVRDCAMKVLEAALGMLFPQAQNFIPHRPTYLLTFNATLATNKNSRLFPVSQTITAGTPTASMTTR